MNIYLLYIKVYTILKKISYYFSYYLMIYNYLFKYVEKNKIKRKEKPITTTIEQRLATPRSRHSPPSLSTNRLVPT